MTRSKQKHEQKIDKEEKIVKAEEAIETRQTPKTKVCCNCTIY